MKLLDLYIGGFGKLHDRTVTFEDGLNIVYGKNEAGKSTLHTFIRSMLFGIERQRGRAARTDAYSRFLPWENKGTFEGRLRLEKDGHIYRIERNFQNSRELSIVDETDGRQIEPTKAFMDNLLNGLSETAYNNTISIGQLKSATEAGMVAELRNYIANLNTSGNLALNITKATAFLKAQRKAFENQMVPEAARSYTGSVKRNRAILNKTISSPRIRESSGRLSRKRETMWLRLFWKSNRRKRICSRRSPEDSSFCRGISSPRNRPFSSMRMRRGSFTPAISLRKYPPQRNPGRSASSLPLSPPSSAGAHADPSLLRTFFHCSVSGCHSGQQESSLIFLAIGMIAALQNKGVKRDLSYSTKLLQEIFSRHLGDSFISQEAMNAFCQRMGEYRRLCAALIKSEETARILAKELDDLQAQQTACTEVIEQQQRTHGD